MSLHHASPGEAIDIRRGSEALPEEKSCALVKTERFEVMRLILLEGQQVPAHHVEGPLTLQCLEGSVTLKTLPSTTELHAGDWLYIDSAEPFSLHADADSALLMTVIFEN